MQCIRFYQQHWFPVISNVTNVTRYRTSGTFPIQEKSLHNVKAWRKIPGPSSLPFIGNLHHFLPGGSLYQKDGYLFHKHLLATYGPIVKMNMFGKHTILYIFDPESAEKIFRNENIYPVRLLFDSMNYYRTKYKNNRIEGEPTGLLSDQGEIWKNLRSKVNPIMLQPKTVQLYGKVLDEIACDMVSRIKFKRDQNNMIPQDFILQMNLWALESIACVALGRRLNCFYNYDKIEDSPEKKLLQSLRNFFIVTEKLDFYPSLWKYFSTKKFKESMQIQEDIERLCLYFINKTIEEYNVNDNRHDDLKGVLIKLLEVDKKISVIMASDMLFAGVDTTSNAVTACLYYLAVNQEKQIKLREEIMSNKTNYLKACIKESMRLLPVASGSMRLTTKSYNLLGFDIPQDVCVVYPHHNVCLMESQFPRCEEFIPERWLVDKTDPLFHKNAHPFTYLPFGFGARTCIGRRIVELEMQCLLARLIENFQVEWVGPPPATRQTIITYVQGPYNFIWKDV